MLNTSFIIFTSRRYGDSSILVETSLSVSEEFPCLASLSCKQYDNSPFLCAGFVSIHALRHSLNQGQSHHFNHSPMTASNTASLNEAWGNYPDLCRHKFVLSFCNLFSPYFVRQYPYSRAVNILHAATSLPVIVWQGKFFWALISFGKVVMPLALIKSFRCLWLIDWSCTLTSSVKKAVGVVHVCRTE